MATAPNPTPNPPTPSPVPPTPAPKNPAPVPGTPDPALQKLIDEQRKAYEKDPAGYRRSHGGGFSVGAVGGDQLAEYNIRQQMEAEKTAQQTKQQAKVPSDSESLAEFVKAGQKAGYNPAEIVNAYSQGGFKQPSQKFLHEREDNPIAGIAGASLAREKQPIASTPGGFLYAEAKVTARPLAQYSYTSYSDMAAKQTPSFLQTVADANPFKSAATKSAEVVGSFFKPAGEILKGSLIAEVRVIGGATDFLISKSPIGNSAPKIGSIVNSFEAIQSKDPNKIFEAGRATFASRPGEFITPGDVVTSGIIGASVLTGGFAAGGSAAATHILDFAGTTLGGFQIGYGGAMAVSGARQGNINKASEGLGNVALGGFFAQNAVKDVVVRTGSKEVPMSYLSEEYARTGEVRMPTASSSAQVLSAIRKTETPADIFRVESNGKQVKLTSEQIEYLPFKQPSYFEVSHASASGLGRGSVTIRSLGDKPGLEDPGAFVTSRQQTSFAFTRVATPTNSPSSKMSYNIFENLFGVPSVEVARVLGVKSYSAQSLSEPGFLGLIKEQSEIAKQGFAIFPTKRSMIGRKEIPRKSFIAPFDVPALNTVKGQRITEAGTTEGEGILPGSLQLTRDVPGRSIKSRLFGSDEYVNLRGRAIAVQRSTAIQERTPTSFSFEELAISRKGNEISEIRGESYRLRPISFSTISLRPSNIAKSASPSKSTSRMSISSQSVSKTSVSPSSSTSLFSSIPSSISKSSSSVSSASRSSISTSSTSLSTSVTSIPSESITIVPGSMFGSSTEKKRKKPTALFGMSPKVTKYTPTIFSQEMNIRGKKSKLLDITSGFGVRPI